MAVYVAGAALIGDELSSSGQSATNAQNLAIAQMQDQFQASQMQKAEQYDTQMSDTAMQRRVQDLEAAGLNPLLAVSSGGASSPTVTGGSGASIAMQNPDASFGQLGNQAAGVRNAMVQQAQIQATNAAADKSRADTATVLAQLPFSGATAMQSYANLRDQEANLSATFDNITADTSAKMDANERANQMFPVQQQINQVDLQRARLGLPRLEDDAAWQKSHPALSGWLQSGAGGQAPGVTGIATQFLK